MNIIRLETRVKHVKVRQFVLIIENGIHAKNVRVVKFVCITNEGKCVLIVMVQLFVNQRMNHTIHCVEHMEIEGLAAFVHIVL